MENGNVKLVLNDEDGLIKKLVGSVLVTAPVLIASIFPDQTHYWITAGMFALTLICLVLIWWVFPQDHYVLFTHNHVDFYKRTLRSRYRLSNRIPLDDTVKIRFKQSAGRHGNIATQFFSPMPVTR